MRNRRAAARGRQLIDDARWTAWASRLTLLANAVGRAQAPSTSSADPESLRRALAEVVDVCDRSQVWLALAVLSGRLPDEDTVIEVARGDEFDGGASLVSAIERETTAESAAWLVRVVTGGAVVDVAHTASTDFATGIQRVARETTRRWLATRPATPVAWTTGFQAMRELTALERDRLLDVRAPVDTSATVVTTVVVPWHTTYVLPELAAEPERSTRLRALARFATNRTGVIGFDCVPITSAETTQLGLSAVFAGNLSAVRYFDRVAAISSAAKTEYDGWRATLSAIGVDGPEVGAVVLPVEVDDESTWDVEAAVGRFQVGTLPLVLVVGSHEPRKNHLAVLHAADLLWREGREFSLSFVGGNAWGSDAFVNQLAVAQRAGRPVDTESRLSDARLWAAYALARFTVFPSLNEGFGLPVAESLAVGTPVITSSFGSMLEIAKEGGALVVDPRDDVAIADAMRELLTNDRTLERLREEAAQRPTRTWDQYADEAWAFLADTAADRPGGGAG
ncbi:glycosyltransferase family 4 protein [Cellulomonas sp. McL0617]|uniref:glycosyltransferase family 4 protein n=1 Tax=Cellulomonas sp. McL0617 TaxID=3415675 RepID=UPI003CFA88C1